MIAATAEETTWAVKLHDDVVVWLRPFREVYAARGYDLDDTAQEARLALLNQQGYLTKLWTEVFERNKDALYCGAESRATEADKVTYAAAKTIAVRAVRRKLLGRSKDCSHMEVPTNFVAWDEMHKIEKTEHDGEVALELVEIVENAPADVAAYLKLVLSQSDAERAVFNWSTAEAMDGVKTRAARFVLDWITTHHRWSHES